MALAELNVPKTPQQTSLFRNILVAVDFSPASRHALAEALALAHGSDACLHVVHVFHNDWRYEMVPSPPELNLERIDAEHKLAELIAELKSERQIDSILVKDGPIATAILSIAAELGTDLLVVGTHGRGGFSKLALGSVSEELLRIAPFPVVTVGPKVEIAVPESRSPIHTILFATDFGPGSMKALPLVITLTKTYHAKLILLHMIAPIPASSSSLSAFAPASAAADEVEVWSGSTRKRALQQLKEYLPPGYGLEQEPEYFVGTDFLPEGLLSAAGRFNVDLIVMGANRTAAPRIAAHVPWTAVHEVIVRAPCPVLTVAG